MGLTSEQRYKKIVRVNSIREIQLKDEEDFIFVSYKSDDWEIVLDTIVRKLQATYGLKVYFSKEIDAIDSPHCKGILAFVSKSYMESPTCLKEIAEANSSASRSQLQWKDEPMGIIPVVINWLSTFEDVKSKSTETSKAIEKILTKYSYKIAVKDDESFYQNLVDTIKNLECNGEKIGNSVFNNNKWC